MIDTHTHTVLSGHAWSTLRENAVVAAKRGMAGMCLTEHGSAMPCSGPFFLTQAQRMLPPEVEGVRVYYGVEANIMDMRGGLDIEDRMLFASEWNIASMHDVCVAPGNEEENTASFKAALAHPAVDMLGHIDDAKTPNVFEEVVKEAGNRARIIEINNNSLLMRRGSRERVETIARLCTAHGVRVAVSSDAHFDTMIGAVEPALELLERIGFPDDLIINRTRESFETYLAERAKRLDAARESFLGNRRSARRMAQGGK
jgi:putative hydrolase